MTSVSTQEVQPINEVNNIIIQAETRFEGASYHFSLPLATYRIDVWLGPWNKKMHQTNALYKPKESK
jgi:hypothetical protein